MNRLLIGLLTLSLATAVVAQTDTSPAVEASKAAKEKRKKSSTKVITNKDVKKSKGKLAETAGTATEVTPAPPESLVEKYEAERKAKSGNDARRAVLEKAIADLERELARIEQSYYEENDLNRRDTVIAARFAETKAKLDAARQDLDAITPKPKPE